MTPEPSTSQPNLSLHAARAACRQALLGAALLALLACGEDAASAADAGPVGVAGSSADAGQPRYWQCRLADHGCTCDNNLRQQPSIPATCGETHCCYSRVTAQGFRACNCVSEARLGELGRTCSEQEQASDKDSCMPGDTCEVTNGCPLAP